MHCGQSLPTRASDTKLPIPARGIRRVVAIVDHSMLPQSLQTHVAAAWTKDGKTLLELLKSILPRGQKGKASRQIPLCLILDARDMFELLVVVNYWLAIDAEKRKRVDLHLQTVYERPAVSNDPVRGPDTCIGAADTHELLEDMVGESAAYKAAQVGKNRNQTDAIENPRHLVAKPIRDKFGLVEKYPQHLMRMTVHQLSCVYEACLVLKRNVQTPKKGKTAESYICIPYYKTLLIARNEEKLRLVFGDVYVDGLKEQEHVTFWYFDEHEEEEDTYTGAQKRKRQADKIRTSEETMEQSDYCETSVTPDDL